MESERLEADRLGGQDGPPSLEAISVDDTYFGFRVGKLGILVSAAIHCELIEHVPVNPLPNTQPWFSGLVNLRGNLVPVIDLHRLLGEETADLKKRRLFTIDKGEKAVALWIDGLPEVHGAAREPLDQLPPLPAALERYVPWGYLYQGHAWLGVRFDEFFKAMGRQIALG